MLRSLGGGFRTGAFRTAAAFAALLLAAVAAASLLPADPSFADSHETQTGASSGGNSSGKDSTTSGDANPRQAKEGDTEVWNPVTRREMVLSISFLLFAIIFMGMIIHAFKKHIREKSGEVERIGIVTVLAVGALYLVMAGFGADKVAPAFGIFGTIAGYLLGQVGPRKCRSDQCRRVKTTDEKNA